MAESNALPVTTSNWCWPNTAETIINDKNTPSFVIALRDFLKWGYSVEGTTSGHRAEELTR
jgi:hypothetical protein